MFDFELHLTTQSLSEQEVKAFEIFCQNIEAKPIVILLPEGKHCQQPMISKLIQCESKKALIKAVGNLETQFNENGYEVVRRKIEVPPWHQLSTQHFFENESANYYEWHGKVNVVDESKVKEIATHFGGRLSRNALKKDTKTKFVTFRDYGDEEAILLRINGFKKELSTNDITLIREELEFCIYDSNELLDKGWIN